MAVSLSLFSASQRPPCSWPFANLVALAPPAPHLGRERPARTWEPGGRARKLRCGNLAREFGNLGSETWIFLSFGKQTRSAAWASLSRCSSCLARRHAAHGHTTAVVFCFWASRYAARACWTGCCTALRGCTRAGIPIVWQADTQSCPGAFVLPRVKQNSAPWNLAGKFAALLGVYVLSPGKERSGALMRSRASSYHLAGR